MMFLNGHSRTIGMVESPYEVCCGFSFFSLMRSTPYAAPIDVASVGPPWMAHILVNHCLLRHMLCFRALRLIPDLWCLLWSGLPSFSGRAWSDELCWRVIWVRGRFRGLTVLVFHFNIFRVYISMMCTIPPKFFMNFWRVMLEKKMLSCFPSLGLLVLPATYHLIYEY